jgi:hypothetical protein
VWDWDFKPTGEIVSSIRVLRGHVDLDCKFSDGSTFAGRVDFAGCR